MSAKRRRRKNPTIVGWLPEDPDDPPRLSWREILVIVPASLLVFGVQLAIPDDWQFWQTGAVYLATGLALGLAIGPLLRLWSRRPD